ncbi:MAG: hypothetical protein JJW00_07935 [Sulfurimonas sp.]|nr:hypothetical protein [Sulfurimonas sp.]
MKEKMNGLHDRLVECAIKHKNTQQLLISTCYNNALLPVLNYLIKGIEPTDDEILVAKYLIEQWEVENNQNLKMS